MFIKQRGKIFLVIDTDGIIVKAFSNMLDAIEFIKNSR
jgi:hypothetical protein